MHAMDPTDRTELTRATELRDQADGSEPPRAAIRLERGTKRYGAVTALNELTLDVGRGELFGLIGPGEPGKPTTNTLMAGFHHPNRGPIEVLGRDPVADHRAITGAVGYLSQR